VNKPIYLTNQYMRHMYIVVQFCIDNYNYHYHFCCHGVVHFVDHCWQSL